MPAKKQQQVKQNGGQSLWIIKGLILLLLVGVTTFAIAMGGSSATNGNALATSNQAERSTELYFSNTHSLEKKVPIGTKVTAQAHIVNHEGEATSYVYVVTVTPNKQGTLAEPKEVQRGTVNINAEESAKLPIEFSAPAEAGDYDVTVRLEGRSEVIHYALGVEK